MWTFCRQIVGVIYLALALLLLIVGYFGFRYCVAFLDGRRPESESQRFTDTAKIREIASASMCRIEDSLVLAIGYLPLGYNDSFFVSEIHLERGGSQSNDFGFQSMRRIPKDDKLIGDSGRVSMDSIDVSQVHLFLDEFSVYEPIEKNVARDSINSVMVVSLCDSGYSKRLDCTYSYYNSPQMRRLMRIASRLWGDEAVNDSGTNAVRRNAKWFLDRCWMWSEGVSEYWFRDAMDDVFSLFSVALLGAIFAPFMYVFLSRRPWVFLAIFVVVACFVYSVPVMLLNDKDYEFGAILFFPPAILVVWVVCHVIWWYGYRNDSGESKK